jgi:hypothetical protein
MNCSNSLQNEESFEIDEQLKAKIFTRLVREYRRSLEHQQRMMVQEQKEREIEVKMKNRFPELMQNQVEEKQGIKKEAVKYYHEANAVGPKKKSPKRKSGSPPVQRYANARINNTNIS